MADMATDQLCFQSLAAQELVAMTLESSRDMILKGLLFIDKI